MQPARSDSFVAPECWRPEWAASSPLFDPIRWLNQHTPLERWPDQNDFDNLAKLQQQLPGIRFVLPENLPDIDEYYETRIHRSGKVPTRANNWHDFFNAAIWLTFPLTKQALNQRHILGQQHSDSRGRGPLRDAATLLDESGVVVAYCDETFPQLLQHHQWQQLFVAQRSQWGSQISAITFGHAIYEKALAPYIGFTAKAWLQPVSADFFQQSAQQQMQALDRLLAERLSDPQQLTQPRDLSALPVLGVPGWWPDNVDPAFYDNRDYFRPARSRA